MMAEFANGYVLETMHLPDRAKPIFRLSRDGEYRGHAVFKDDDSCAEFMAFMEAIWGDGRDE